MVFRLLFTGTSAAALLTARATLRNWGATKAECRAVLPGDELVADPAVVITRAVTVEAAPDDIWPWLVQIGQNRGGLYSYEWLENALGLDIHNADEIRPQWQHLAPGDRVWLVRRGWLGTPDGLALTVSRIEPGHFIVLYEEPWQAAWSFHIRPHGPNHSRLICRSRSPRQHGVAWLGSEIFDPVSLLMTRKMLLGIKARAEGSARAAYRERAPAAPAEMR